MTEDEKVLTQIETLLEWVRSNYHSLPKDVLLSICDLANRERERIEAAVPEVLH